MTKANKEINRLKRENKKLNELCVQYGFDMGRLEEKNEQLQVRNDRQAKQLDNLYKLIEKEDWATLQGIIQDFKDSDKQLQKEWKCYE